MLNLFRKRKKQSAEEKARAAQQIAEQAELLQPVLREVPKEPTKSITQLFIEPTVDEAQPVQREKQLANMSYPNKRERKKAAKRVKRNRKKQAKLNKKHKLPKTVQDTIPYRQIFKDGLCQIDAEMYSVTLEYKDVNYQLAQQEEKENIFRQYCGFLNQFDSSVNVQLTFVNRKTRAVDVQHSLILQEQNDDHNHLRKERNEMLLNAATQGDNNIEKTKYITLTIKAKDQGTAQAKLSRIETLAKNTLKSTIGCRVSTLDGYDRLKVLHNCLNKDGSPFWFNWDIIAKTGLSTKDFIAPTSFDFRSTHTFRIGSTIGTVNYLQILTSELEDDILAKFLGEESEMILNLHLSSIDQTLAIKQVKKKIAALEKQKIEEQRRAVKSGYDMDILPPDLLTYLEEAKGLLYQLQSRNERLFAATIIITSFAENEEQLKNDLLSLDSIAQGCNCHLKRLDFQQEDGLVSSLPLGLNRLSISRTLTTAGAGIFIPFTTQELFMDSGIYYGLNALSSNLIVCDRKKLKNPNGLILGTPGSGKSFSAKREVQEVLLTTDDDIIIIDPEAEYGALVEQYGGQIIRISQSSSHHINPMDINLNLEDDPKVAIDLKTDFIVSLCELLVGGKNGLDPKEAAIIDDCVRDTYAPYVQDPQNQPMPILQDFHRHLSARDNPLAQDMAIALGRYVNGSLSVFNHPTNVDLSNRLVCFDIKELGKQMKKMGMLIVQEQVWTRVSSNREAGKKTWFYIDEFHLLLKEIQTAEYSVEIWKRFRKWGGIPTGITQNVKDLLASREVENILENSDFIYMLNQASGDRAELAERLAISEDQLAYVTNSAEGHGLLFFGNVIIPFADKFPKHTEMYRMMTTKPEEIAAIKRQGKTAG